MKTLAGVNINGDLTIKDTKFGGFNSSEKYDRQIGLEVNIKNV